MADCVSTCEQQNLMRAVPPEMIREECRQQCSEN
jgi:hypothetical protein